MGTKVLKFSEIVVKIVVIFDNPISDRTMFTLIFGWDIPWNKVLLVQDI